MKNKRNNRSRTRSRSHSRTSSRSSSSSSDSSIDAEYILNFLKSIRTDKRKKKQKKQRKKCQKTTQSQVTNGESNDNPNKTAATVENNNTNEPNSQAAESLPDYSDVELEDIPDLPNDHIAEHVDEQDLEMEYNNLIAAIQDNQDKEAGARDEDDLLSISSNFINTMADISNTNVKV